MQLWVIVSWFCSYVRVTAATVLTTNGNIYQHLLTSMVFIVKETSIVSRVICLLLMKGRWSVHCTHCKSQSVVETWKGALACFCWSCPLCCLFCLMFQFTGPGGRFGDRHLKVPKTAKTHVSGSLPRKGSINWSNMCKPEEIASVGLPNIPIGFPTHCILLYRPKVKKCLQMQLLGSFSCVLQTDVFII